VRGSHRRRGSQSGEQKSSLINEEQSGFGGTTNRLVTKVTYALSLAWRRVFANGVYHEEWEESSGVFRVTIVYSGRPHLNNEMFERGAATNLMAVSLFHEPVLKTIFAFRDGAFSKDNQIVGAVPWSGASFP